MRDAMQKAESGVKVQEKRHSVGTLGVLKSSKRVRYKPYQSLLSSDSNIYRFATFFQVLKSQALLIIERDVVAFLFQCSTGRQNRIPSGCVSFFSLSPNRIFP